MKRITTTALISIFIFAAAGIFTYFNKSSAQRTYTQQWEYAAITSVFYFEPEKERINKIYGIVSVCIMKSSGCEQLEIRQELDYGKFLKDANLQENYQSRIAASKKASETAFYKALSRLGNEGWELVAEPKREFFPVDLYEYEKLEDKSLMRVRENTEAVYLKRSKK